MAENWFDEIDAIIKKCVGEQANWFNKNVKLVAEGKIQDDQIHNFDVFLTICREKYLHADLLIRLEKCLLKNYSVVREMAIPRHKKKKCPMTDLGIILKEDNLDPELSMNRIGIEMKAAYIGFDGIGRAENKMTRETKRDTRMDTIKGNTGFKYHIKKDIEKLKDCGRGYLIILGFYGANHNWGNLENEEEWDEHKKILNEQQRSYRDKIEIFWNHKWL